MNRNPHSFHPLAPGSAGGSNHGTHPHQTAFGVSAFQRFGVSPRIRSSFRGRRAFSLTELMVAVAVLIIVVIATSKIFGTAGQITRAGEATTSLLRTAAVIEKQMRDDIARLAPDGFFAIHSVAVRNDVRGSNFPLLDPTKLGDFLFRCDQMMFFTDGVQGVQTYRQGRGSDRDGQGSAARVYYGHAFQLPNALPVYEQSATELRAHDPAFGFLTALGTFTWASQIPPWFPDSLNRPGLALANSPLLTMTGTVFLQSAGAAEYTTPGTAALPPQINAQQPPAHEWILAREAIILVDDDIDPAGDPSKVVFGSGNNRSLYSIFPIANVQNTCVRKGRVDASAQLTNEVRQYVTLTNPATDPPGVAPWTRSTPGPSQRGRIMQAMYYPRAERRPPGQSRVDQALTNNALGVGCSSFRIEWTYDDRVGEAIDTSGNIVLADPNGIPNSGDEFFFEGVEMRSEFEHPWFGLYDPSASVFNYGDQNSPFLALEPGGFPIFSTATTIDPANIETTLTPPLPTWPDSAIPPANPGLGFRDYWAVFGYNQTMPFHDTRIDPDGAAANFTGAPIRAYAPGIGREPTPANSNQIGYTPWPSAIRVTLVLNDPDGKLEGGREFQFVIDLPKRVP